MTLGSHTVAVAMPGSQARVQPNKVKLSKNGPHVRAMDLGPKTRMLNARGVSSFND